MLRGEGATVFLKGSDELVKVCLMLRRTRELLCAVDVEIPISSPVPEIEISLVRDGSYPLGDNLQGSRDGKGRLHKIASVYKESDTCFKPNASAAEVMYGNRDLVMVEALRLDDNGRNPRHLISRFAPAVVRRLCLSHKHKLALLGAVHLPVADEDLAAVDFQLVKNGSLLQNKSLIRNI